MSKIDPDLLAARYGRAPNLPARTTSVIETMLGHRSVRAFTPEPLAPGMLESIVAAAQSASSSSNLQTWSVVAVQSRDQKAALGALIGQPQLITGCATFLMWLADLSRLYQCAAAHGVETEGLDFFEGTLVSVIDTALAAQNAAVAAESLGLGIVYVGAMRNRPEAVAEILGLPPHVICLFGMSVGYPAPGDMAMVKPRLPQSAVLSKDRYRDTPPVAEMAAYDETMSAFYRASAMEREAWSLYSARRVRNAAAIHGRDRLKSVFRALGFLLK